MKIKSLILIPAFLIFSGLMLSACDSNSTSDNQSSTTTPAPTTIVSDNVSPTDVITPTPTMVPVESDANIQKLFDADKDTGLDTDIQKLQKDLQ